MVYIRFPLRFFPALVMTAVGSVRMSSLCSRLVEETLWQRMVAGNLDFDAETHYPETMQVLDLEAEEPAWELRTADDLRREDQKGHQSLREKYGKRQKEKRTDF